MSQSLHQSASFHSAASSSSDSPQKQIKRTSSLVKMWPPPPTPVQYTTVVEIPQSSSCKGEGTPASSVKQQNERTRNSVPSAASHDSKGFETPTSAKSQRFQVCASSQRLLQLYPPLQEDLLNEKASETNKLSTTTKEASISIPSTPSATPRTSITFMNPSLLRTPSGRRISQNTHFWSPSPGNRKAASFTEKTVSRPPLSLPVGPSAPSTQTPSLSSSSRGLRPPMSTTPSPQELASVSEKYNLLIPMSSPRQQGTPAIDLSARSPPGKGSSANTVSLSKQKRRPNKLQKRWPPVSYNTDRKKSSTTLPPDLSSISPMVSKVKLEYLLQTKKSPKPPTRNSSPNILSPNTMNKARLSYLINSQQKHLANTLPILVDEPKDKKDQNNTRGKSEIGAVPVWGFSEDGEREREELWGVPTAEEETAGREARSHADKNEEDKANSEESKSAVPIWGFSGTGEEDDDDGDGAWGYSKAPVAGDETNTENSDTNDTNRDVAAAWGFSAHGDDNDGDEEEWEWSSDRNTNYKIQYQGLTSLHLEQVYGENRDEAERPDVWVTPVLSPSDQNNTDATARAQKWKVKRVWNVEEADEKESEHFVSSPELMTTIRNLFGAKGKAEWKVREIEYSNLWWNMQRVYTTADGDFDGCDSELPFNFEGMESEIETIVQEGVETKPLTKTPLRKEEKGPELSDDPGVDTVLHAESSRKDEMQTDNNDTFEPSDGDGDGDAEATTEKGPATWHKRASQKTQPTGEVKMWWQT